MFKNYRKQILRQNVQMDSCVNFMTNGDITVVPCPWEDDKKVTNGERVRYEAGIEVDANGLTRVKRWKRGLNGPKYLTVFETAHGVVKIPRRWKKENPVRQHIVVEFKFPRKYGLALTKERFEEETDEVMSFLSTRKEETIWDR